MAGNNLQNRSKQKRNTENSFEIVIENVETSEVTSFKTHKRAFSESDTDEEWLLEYLFEDLDQAELNENVTDSKAQTSLQVCTMDLPSLSKTVPTISKNENITANNRELTETTGDVVVKKEPFDETNEIFKSELEIPFLKKGNESDNECDYNGVVLQNADNNLNMFHDQFIKDHKYDVIDMKVENFDSHADSSKQQDKTTADTIQETFCLKRKHGRGFHSGCWYKVPSLMSEDEEVNVVKSEMSLNSASDSPVVDNTIFDEDADRGLTDIISELSCPILIASGHCSDNMSGEDTGKVAENVYLDTASIDSDQSIPSLTDSLYLPEKVNDNFTSDKADSDILNTDECNSDLSWKPKGTIRFANSLHSKIITCLGNSCECCSHPLVNSAKLDNGNEKILNHCRGENEKPLGSHYVNMDFAEAMSRNQELYKVSDTEDLAVHELKIVDFCSERTEAGNRNKGVICMDDHYYDYNYIMADKIISLTISDSSLDEDVEQSICQEFFSLKCKGGHDINGSNVSSKEGFENDTIDDCEILEVDAKPNNFIKRCQNDTRLCEVRDSLVDHVKYLTAKDAKVLKEDKKFSMNLRERDVKSAIKLGNLLEDSEDSIEATLNTFKSYRIVNKRYVDRCTGNTTKKLVMRVKERKTYTDHELDDDDIEGKRSYKIEDKLSSDKYNKDYVKKLKGEEFNLRYLQENGLQYPIIFQEKAGLGLRVPSDNFKVSDVKACVGSRRMLDVMDVNTQKGLEMTMKEWVKYYEEPDRQRLLNVISLEFSHTKLENYVESPNLVREVDWVDTAWPQHLKDCQTESTNAIDKMKYPKVQKYCLMSVAGCYTDFHIDFGGTSVWYHILHGEKIFWLIPPTDKNLSKYENWVLSGKQGDAFLADSIEECQMIQLKAGNTFIIPSGWIHAVFTPKDSLVFGGNFLHSFNMVNQLKVSAIEDKTHVPMKFRYPFYAEINWYVLERYVHSLTGVTYLEKPQLNEDLEVITTKSEKDQPSLEALDEKFSKRLSVSLTRIDDTSPGRKSTSDDDSTASGPTRSPGQASTLPRSSRKSSSESANSLDLKTSDFKDVMKAPYKSPVKKKAKYVHLTKYELEGLIEVVAWVESLPPSKKGVPKDLIDADTVLKEVKRLIQEHMKDNPELAITGEPVLEWTKATKKLIKLKQKAKTAKLLGTIAPKAKTAGGKNASGNRHRRVRCKKCEPCTRDDCMECNFCKDMRKYGGPGRAKQSCISRQCLAPLLPKGILCQICKQQACPIEKPPKLDGASDDDNEDFSNSLMECGICWEIVHPLCLNKKYENLNNEGILNEDLPNSWKCSKCCFDGKEGKLMARVFKGGWRPNPTSTPPPSSVSPPPQPQSPASGSDVSVTEGKRVTVNQTVDSKQLTMPKLSSSEEYIESNGKTGIPHANGTTEQIKHEDMKAEPMDTAKTEPPDVVIKVKLEDTNGDTPSANQTETAASNQKSTSLPSTFTVSNQKRSSSPLEENPAKKKRNQSPSPSRGGKSSKMSRAQPKPSPSLGRKPVKTATPELTTKRSKRETPQRYGARSTYDFDDEEEFMDVSAPLPEKGRGKGIRGRKNLNLKTKDPNSDPFVNGNNKQTIPSEEIKPEEKNSFEKKQSEKINNDQLKQTLIEHIQRRNLPIIQPKFVVRPAPISPPDDYCVMVNGQKHPLSRKMWTKIFRFLSPGDLANCLAVNQTWNQWCINPDLWKKIDLSRNRIVQAHLMGIVRRQPEYLNLSAVVMTQKQILWLLERIPLLKTLIISKCSWATLSGLCMSACPLLYKLDVSWATGLNDKCFEDLITPPVDRKPGVKNISRLHRLKSLHLSGTEITDAALELMTMHLSQLEDLNISYCVRVTDRGIQMLASSKSATQDSLKVLNISGCRGLTDVSIDAIKNVTNLRELHAVHCTRISTDKCRALRLPRLKQFKF